MGLRADVEGAIVYARFQGAWFSLSIQTITLLSSMKRRTSGTTGTTVKNRTGKLLTELEQSSPMQFDTKDTNTKTSRQTPLRETSPRRMGSKEIGRRDERNVMGWPSPFIESELEKAFTTWDLMILSKRYVGESVVKTHFPSWLILATDK